MEDQSKQHFRREIEILIVLMSACYGLSLFGRYSWLLDLFSHFAFQYIIGGIILGLAVIYCKSWKFAALSFLIVAINIVEIYSHNDFVWSSDEKNSTFTIVQYNRNAGLSDQTQLKDWLTSNASKFDVVILQEANLSLASMASSLGSRLTA